MELDGENAKILRYFPIDFEVRAPATALDLQRLEYLEGRSNLLAAYFCGARPSSLLKVVFTHAVMFRVIDDFHHPIETYGFTDVGHIPNHFAYRVEGSPFWAAQKEVLSAVFPGVSHYLFVTGGSCLDALSVEEPVFSWVRVEKE